MNHMYSFVLSVLLASLARAQGPPQQPLRVVPEVDLQRYMGIWYEIARLPNSFQDHCAGDVTAIYTLRDDGKIQVVNRCRKEDGTYSEAKGLGKRASRSGPNSKLKVRFAPGYLSFLPFVWGDYWIIILAPDYSHVVVGEPGRKYLWILSRQPTMDEAGLQHILEEVSQKGYDLTGLVRTQHEAE